MSENLPPSVTPTPAPTPAPTAGPNEKDVRMWNMLCHLSALAGFIIPFGSIVGPLLVWQIKKQEIPSVEAHGKAALNFQITVLIAVIVTVVAGFVLTFIFIGVLLFPVAALIGLAGLICSIIAGIKANEGKEFKYPLSLKLL